MDRTQKEEMVADLNSIFNEAAVIVVTHYIGLSVGEITGLRTNVRDAGAKFLVTKNSLTRRAIEGTASDSIRDLFTGPTAIAYSDDPVAAPKAAVNFAKENEKLVVLGGIMGDQVLDAEAVKSLASLPSLDELRGMIVGMISTPATRIAAVLAAPAGQVARVISAYGSSEEAA